MKTHGLKKASQYKTGTNKLNKQIFVSFDFIKGFFYIIISVYILALNPIK